MVDSIQVVSPHIFDRFDDALCITEDVSLDLSNGVDLGVGWSWGGPVGLLSRGSTVRLSIGGDFWSPFLKYFCM